MNEPSVEDSSVLGDVSGSTFQRLVLEGSGPIVVEFMSYGCGHCRALEPVLRHVAETLRPQETFYRVNVAVDQELANAYGITGTPTLLMFRDAKERGRVVGPQPKESTLRKAVSQPFDA